MFAGTQDVLRNAAGASYFNYKRNAARFDCNCGVARCCVMDGAQRWSTRAPGAEARALRAPGLAATRYAQEEARKGVAARSDKVCSIGGAKGGAATVQRQVSL